MSDVSAGEVGGIVAGVLAVAAALGKAAQWVWASYRDAGASRSAKLDRWHDELTQREHALKAEMDRQLSEMRVVQEELEAHRIAIHVLVAKVARDDPHAPELRQVADVLGAAFPLHMEVPADMAAVLGRVI
jgi:hypothetical protein